MPAYKRRTWTEKYNASRTPMVEVAAKAFGDLKPGDRMLIPTPAVVNAFLKKIPYGTEQSMKNLRQHLAEQFNADVTCPITSGIFLRIIAEMEYERFQNGVPPMELSPFWRVITPGSPAAKKLYFGTQFLIEQRRLEGLLNN